MSINSVKTDGEYAAAYLKRSAVPTRVRSIPRRDHIDDILDLSTQLTLRRVTSGTCALLDPDDVTKNQEISEKRNLSADDVQLLTKLLLDANSWFWCVKRCLPKGTAIIRLKSQKLSAMLWIGVPCAGWKLTIAGNSVSGFFDPVQNEVHGILKLAFSEFASPQTRSMWKAGAIANLKKASLTREP